MLSKGSLNLLQLGQSAGGGSGCYCPENTFLKKLLNHLVLEEQDTVIVDMEAGLEHMSRGTARGVDAFIVVAEPGKRSFQTARDTVRLAQDLGVKEVFAVVNKVHPGQEDTVLKEMAFIPVLGMLPYRPAVIEADLSGLPLYEISPEMVKMAENIKAKLEQQMNTP